MDASHSQNPPASQPMPDRDTSSKIIVDQAMWKYVLAWFWTGIFGTNAGIAFTFVSYRDYTRWGPLVLLPALLYLIGAVAALLSLSSLIRYLRFLIPLFVPGAKQDPHADDPQVHTVYLTRALWALVFAIGARFAITIAEVLFSLAKS
jgi:hypothetical protein